MISIGSGLVCANFGQERGNGLLCDRVWHGSCYQQSVKDPFPVLQVADLDECLLGSDALEEEDPDCFKCARDSDHLMCPFQCDECHFYNIQKRCPGVRAQDDVLLMYIQRANLDTLWARESATVHANW